MTIPACDAPASRKRLSSFFSSCGSVKILTIGVNEKYISGGASYPRTLSSRNASTHVSSVTQASGSVIAYKTAVLDGPAPSSLHLFPIASPWAKFVQDPGLRFSNVFSWVRLVSGPSGWAGQRPAAGAAGPVRRGRAQPGARAPQELWGRRGPRTSSGARRA